MKRLAILGTALAAACAPAPPAYYPPPDAGPPPPMAGPDQCGASRYQWRVGRHRSAIPPQPPGARWRVACLGCPVTMDYSPSRLNIFYEERSGIVREVRCG